MNQGAETKPTAGRSGGRCCHSRRRRQRESKCNGNGTGIDTEQCPCSASRSRRWTIVDGIANNGAWTSWRKANLKDPT